SAASTPSPRPRSLFIPWTSCCPILEPLRDTASLYARLLVDAATGGRRLGLHQATRRLCNRRVGAVTAVWRPARDPWQRARRPVPSRGQAAGVSMPSPPVLPRARA